MFEILSPGQYPEYDDFVAGHKNGTFMQATAWATVKSGWGSAVVACKGGDGKIAGGMLLLIRKIGLKTMLYAPRGPVCNYEDKEMLARLLAGAKAVAKKHGAYILKMDPYVVEGCQEEEAQVAAFLAAGCTLKRDAPFFATIQPRHSYMMPQIGGMSAEEVLMSFDAGTRYSVRLPQKSGIICENLGLAGLEDFYKIYKETGVRQGFTVRPKVYLEKLLTAFGENARLYMCSFEGKPLCGGIAVQFAGKTAHLYGCSTDEMRKQCPTYLLQWALINWALEGRCTVYDMQGIALKEEDSKALFGVYGFKKHFTGRVVSTVGEFDVVYDAVYEKLADFAMKLRTKIKKSGAGG